MIDFNIFVMWMIGLFMVGFPITMLLVYIIVQKKDKIIKEGLKK